MRNKEYQKAMVNRLITENVYNREKAPQAAHHHQQEKQQQEQCSFAFCGKINISIISIISSGASNLQLHSSSRSSHSETSNEH